MKILFFMKKLVVLLVMFSISLTFAQKTQNVKYTKQGDLTAAVYFYDNGSIQQEGTFNKDGQLHGIWTSYDVEGNKVAVGKYVDGKKVGKWYFWTKDNIVREVEYSDSRIVNVTERKDVF